MSSSAHGAAASDTPLLGSAHHHQPPPTYGTHEAAAAAAAAAAANEAHNIIAAVVGSGVHGAGLLEEPGQGPGPAGGGGTFARNLGALDAFAIIIAIVIGSGIFTSPGSIDTNVPSPGVALVVWLVGGMLAWTGAGALAELGTAIPGEGGIQRWLKYIYGDVWGHLAAWTWVVAIMPASVAILSIVFVESIFSAAGITDQAASASHKLLSILIMLLINTANSISTKASTRLNNFFVGTKFTAIFGIVLAGIVVLISNLASPASPSDPQNKGSPIGGGDWRTHSWFAPRDTVTPAGTTIHWQDVGTWELLGYLSTALYGALWAYSGWDKGIYVSAELANPTKQLPLALNTAIPTIMLCFLATNAAYYLLLPWDVVSTTDSVAVTAIARLLGRTFGILAAVLICLVVAGSMLGNSFVAGRMAVAAANADWLPRAFAIVGRIGWGPAPGGHHHHHHQQHYQQVSVHIQADDDDDDDDEATVTAHDDTLAAAANLAKPSSSSADQKEAADAPINAIILNALLSILFIALGDFRSLVTFNGLAEYTFFFLTVLGAVILRFREPGLYRPYRPVLVVPVVFTLVCGFVLVRGAVFAPTQALVLVALWVLGYAFYVWWRREEE